MAVNRRIYLYGFGLLLVLASIATYHGALKNSRLPEEERLIWLNPAVAAGDFSLGVRGVWEAGEFRPQVRPVPILVRYLEHSLWDFDRGKYQLDQIVLHAIAGFLLFLLMRRWTRSVAAGAFASLIFIVHPAGSQSVLFLGGLSEILCAIFFLGALLAIPDARAPGARSASNPPPVRYFLIAVLGALAMLSKETGFILPLVGAGMVLVSRLEKSQARRCYLALLAAAVISLVWRGIAIASLGEPLRRIPAIDPTTAVPIHVLLPRALAGIAVEVGSLVLPIRLNHEESWLLILQGWRLPALIGVAMFFILGGVYLAARRGGDPARTTLALLLVLPLLGAAAIPWLTGSLASDRNAYLAVAGFAGLLVLLGRRIGSARPEAGPLLAGLAAGLVLLYGVRSAIRTGDYANNGKLLSASLAVRPDNPQVLFEMGNEKLLVPDYPAAIELYKRALQLRPEFGLASVNLGAAYLGQDDLGMALRTLDPVASKSRHVYPLRMIYAKANYHAGLVLMKQERYKEAAEAFERTLLYYPDHFGARLNLGLIYIKAPHYAERGIALLRGVLKEEQDPARRESVQKGLSKAEGLLMEYRDKQGTLPPASRGALGEPWKVASEEGM